MAALQNSGYPFGGRILNIAYSDLGIVPMNTAEHFQLAAHLGFNSLKGDVRITADKGLVMCHDEGVTLDENGRIDRYDRNNQQKFRDLSFADVKAMEYAYFADKMGHHARACDFETYVRICRDNEKIAYVTVREYNIPDMIAGVLGVLQKYNMEDRCIINSFTYEALQEVRKYTGRIPVSQVFDFGYLPDEEDLNRLLALGNSIMCLFWYLPARTEEHWAEADKLLADAAQASLPVYMAIVPSREPYEFMLGKGFQGFQLIRAILPYTRCDIHFRVVVENGAASFVNILGSDTYAADISAENGVVSVENITYAGSEAGYADGLPALWMNVLDYRLEVCCPENPESWIFWDGKALRLDTGNRDGVYRVHISV
ncbi:MAG: hypothetical protein IJD13_06550 [Oscillospiraceae bacterium]|nr:hypothetical protein [Oscillospiraceae bacterium]